MGRIRRVGAWQWKTLVASFALIASLAAFAVAAATANAALHPGQYTLRTVTLTSSSGVAGSYLSCPTGQRIVAGGAFWHQPGKGPLPSNASNDYIASSTPTTDAKGWYADGYTSVADRLTITALCLPKSQVGSYTLKTMNLSVPAHSPSGSYLSCPTGQRIVAGGAFWHQPGQGPTPSNAITDSIGSSTPTTDAKGWYADGFTSVASRLTITALCLPA